MCWKRCFCGFPLLVSVADYGITLEPKDILRYQFFSTWLDVGNWNAMTRNGETDENNNAILGDSGTDGYHQHHCFKASFEAADCAYECG